MQYTEDTNELCLTYHEYVRTGIATVDVYKNQRKRNEIIYYGNGEDALIVFDSLPFKYKAKVRAKYGDVHEYAAKQPLLDMLERDMEARRYYAEDVQIPADLQRRYSRQADWLNLINKCIADTQRLKNGLHIKMGNFWRIIIQLIKADKEDNRLPGSKRRLKDTLERYGNRNYDNLIEWHRIGNNNARSTTGSIERLVLAIYGQYNGRTNATQATREYNEFVMGHRRIVDVSTGELFDPTKYYKKGAPKLLVPQNVIYYINKKENRKAIDLMKLGGGDYVQKHTPYNRRSTPKHAFSIVTMDDYLPPFKTPDGKRTVWMYAIFDVASEAIVGVAYGKDKNWQMVLDALSDMTYNCLQHGWGLPLELEMERSLNYAHRGSKDAKDVFTEGYLFQHIRFVRGGNSQGKRAERLLGAFKYSQLARKQGFLGRPAGRNQDYKLNKDETELRWRQADLIQMLKDAVATYNNEELKDGMSRWEWLCANMNPDTFIYKPEVLVPMVGTRSRDTSIHRGYVSVKGTMYDVPNGATDWCQSNKNGRVPCEAYYLNNAEAVIDKVYLYQKNKFICAAEQAEQYNYATAERTADDWAIMRKQTEKQKDFMKRAKARLAEIPMVQVVDNEQPEVHHHLVGVRKEYDKLRDEEEEYAEITGINPTDDAENEPETGGNDAESELKEGGYVQKNGLEKYIKYGLSSL